MGNSEKEKTSIEGTLLMLDGLTPHVAVPVQAIRDGRAMATVLSDERGGYQFTDLKPGSYRLRCQVLGGYVYYRTTDDKLRVTLYEEESLEPAVEEAGEMLHIEHGKSPQNVDFRFASFKKGTWRTYDTLDGLAHSRVSAIHRDLDGVMWFGTTDGGVSRYDGKEFVNFTEKDGLAGRRVNAIHRDADGMMWFGTASWGGGGCGLSRYDGKGFDNFTTEDGLAHDAVNAIYRDPDGVMWLGTAGGVSR